ncbi:hypothetical protein MERGE_002601 [Pneumocystis wakefieldiae]|uniref:V-type proton ATPase subunit n=1 Tax=Pneumocystis wakefieldiae TaxID=38082 RepID=A0A899FZ74_9ASCO|nr:hypothetical protein MERGE_002601 [Pneumocystis wakefieldiae]
MGILKDCLFCQDINYIDGLVRGYKANFLTNKTYQYLTQCESLEDFKMQLSSTAYGSFLSNVSTLTTSVIARKATEKLTSEFQYIMSQAVYPLSKFMEYITYSYMIDNVILLITGTLHERDTHELLEKCHPLGWFETMPTLCVSKDIEEFYNNVIIDTPLALYFKDYLSAVDLNELNIEIIRNTLYKAYLEDFYAFCKTLGGTTFELMSNILKFEADRRAINITLNSFSTILTKETRRKLYPTIGNLYPEGTFLLSSAQNIEEVKLAIKKVPEYYSFFDDASRENKKSLEDIFSEKEAELNKQTFVQQFHFATVYAWVKLFEQEIRNIAFLTECITQNQQSHATFVSVF